MLVCTNASIVDALRRYHTSSALPCPAPNAPLPLLGPSPPPLTPLPLPLPSFPTRHQGTSSSPSSSPKAAPSLRGRGRGSVEFGDSFRTLAVFMAEHAKILQEAMPLLHGMRREAARAQQRCLGHAVFTFDKKEKILSLG